MTIKFISFGGPSVNYHRAVNRIMHEAHQSKLFTDIKGFTNKDLKEDPEFWKNHGKFLENNKRGYGYWLWKPYLVKKTLSELKDGDLLFYADAGCEIDLSKPKVFLEKRFEIARKEKKIVGCFTCPEPKWTKMDLIKYLNMEKKFKGKQHAATAMLLIKTPEIVKLVDEWWRICTMDNYHYLNDSKSRVPNLKCFCEHRHDQSIFSLLTKKYNLMSNTHLRKKGSIFYTPRRRGGPHINEKQIVKNITSITIKRFYDIKHSQLNVSCKYNKVFGNIAPRREKEIYIKYEDANNKLFEVINPENSKFIINDVNNIILCEYRTLKKNSNFKCYVNI